MDTALSGLGFARDEWSKPPSALSGGEQTRASLARLVIADPDLLLLDEPTNHLDLDALEWLEEHLRRRAGSLLVASHDRAFLDATVGRIWELRDRRLTAFRGDYTAYHRQRVERDARTVKDVETQAEAIAREQELVQRYRSHRKFSKMHEHEARLERLESERRDAPKAGRQLAIPAAGLVGGGPSRIAARSSCGSRTRPWGTCRAAGRWRRTVRRRPSRRSSRARRSWPPSAASGSGSSGRTAPARQRCCEPSPATCRRSMGRITFGTCRADRVPGAAPRAGDRRARRCSMPCSEAIPVTPGEARAYLARFLFRGDDAFKEVRSLSGGERSRLELALLGIQPSNLLLLDEPTNHLDIPAREAIEAFMAGSPATLLVVSHDRRLLETVCEKLWVVDVGRRWRSMAGIGRGARRWRAGGRVEGALETEAARLRGGPPDGQSRAPRSLRRCA